MNPGDNVFLIIRKGYTEKYYPVQIKSFSESRKTYIVILPNKKEKRGVAERNLSLTNHRGEKNKGRTNAN